MTKLSSDIISCVVCNAKKERFLCNPNTNLCVNCWLKGEDLPNKNVEENFLWPDKRVLLKKILNDVMAPTSTEFSLTGD